MDAISGLSNDVGGEFSRSSVLDFESVPLNFEPGSFRDRTSRVFLADGRVYRTLNSEALAAWRRVSGESFFQEMMTSGRIVHSAEASIDGFARLELPSDVAGILEHERIPFVSYPYEWSFGMLREAALLHLQILPRAIRSGLILKDASPYNVQFRGTKPVFIDLGSFT